METSYFTIRNQFSIAADYEGIEYLRFAGDWHDTQTNFSRIGGAGNDFIVAPGDARHRLVGRDDDDALFGAGRADRLFGGAGDDFLDGGRGADRLVGEAGDDILRGGGGADMLFGGPGFDIADYRHSAGGVTVNLTTGKGWRAEAAGDRLVGIEGVHGSGFDDRLVGDVRDNLLLGGFGDDVLYGRRGDDELGGGAGNDRIYGGGENDVIRGAAGDDRLWGGAGRDVFRFKSGDGRDQIHDFEGGLDKIAIGAGASRFRDLDISQNGANAIVKYGGGAIVIIDYDSNDLSWRDFMF